MCAKGNPRKAFRGFCCAGATWSWMWAGLEDSVPGKRMRLVSIALEVSRNPLPASPRGRRKSLLLPLGELKGGVSSDPSLERP